MRLLVDITAHGFGHLSQTAPILTALRELAPMQFVVRTNVRTDILRERLGPDIVQVSTDLEFGLVMHSPFEVDRDATMAKYRDLATQFDEHVARVGGLIQRERCDAVLSNIGFLAIAAGAQVGVPTFACSSLNWGDMFSHYCGALVGAAEIRARIDEAYRSATAIFRLVPGMPMGSLTTIRIDRPIAQTGRDCRAYLKRILGVPDEKKVVLLAFGGMVPAQPPPFLYEGHPLLVIGPSAWQPWGVVGANTLPLTFSDLVASADLVVTKPGYGIVAELACAGTPSVQVSRNDWPEEIHLLEWLHKFNRFRLIHKLEVLDLNVIMQMLTSGMQIEKRERAVPGGEFEIANRVLRYVGDQRD